MSSQLITSCCLFPFILLSLWTGELNNQNYYADIANNADLTLTKLEVEEDLDSLMSAIEKIHPALFHAIPKDKWILLKQSIVEKAPLTYSTFYSQVLRIIALAKGGHTDAYPKKSSKVRHALPAKFLVFPEGLFVVASAPELQPLLGKKILKIEGVPIHNALEKLREIVPSDNKWGKQELLEDYIRMPALLRAVGIDNDREGIPFYPGRWDGKHKD